MRILLGYDGSAEADAALRDLALAGLPARAEARVVTAVKPWVLGPEGRLPKGFVRDYDDYSRETVKAARDQAGIAAAFLSRRFPAWKVKPEAVLGDAARGLLDYADNWKPDLIVVGSHGRSALGRLLLGSTSQRVLHHAATSVRITRPRNRAKPGSPRILAAIDGSAGADAAVRALAARAWPKGTSIRVLGVSDPSPNLGVLLGEAGASLAGRFTAQRQQALHARIEKAVASLSRKGLKAEGVVREGDPRLVVLDEARDWGTDCIFLGCRGVDAWERILLGSVSSNVASHAHCSVEVVRSRDRSRSGGSSGNARRRA